ncbi:spore gernimation protein KC [Paenibacillus sambharensis]|uniref:Spore gernimation protein KC n=1 Tax=Paenibacillus sambharensis TaxID=1803190 RepID=A0A2W1L498_9BACL|nr:endospore germination permease [Paenibacillus sambharensis]PZD94186.1 spore gernimation protein KC [Paenibacillus sambharensis]
MTTPLLERISIWQLFVLVFLFQVGSAIVVGAGAADAKQDLWIAELMGCSIGLVLVLIYVYILRLKPGSSLYDILSVTFGRWLATLFAVLYILYFFYIAGRVLRDFTELLIIDVLPETPLEIVTLLFILTVIYMVYMGMEVLGRMSETFVPYFITFVLLITLFLIAGQDIKLENLLPVLGDGWDPVMKVVFPELITFPYGETVVLMVIMAHTTHPGYMPLTALLATILSGAVLSYHSGLMVAVLGGDMVARSTFPLLSVVREISIANFIERLDALVVFIMMVGIFVKVSLFFYGGLKGLEFLTRIPYRHFVLPCGLMVGFLSIIIAGNFAEHIEEGVEIVPVFLHVPFQIIIPVLMLAVLLIQRWRQRRVKRHGFRRTLQKWK